MLLDSLAENKKAGLTTAETDHVIQGLEHILTDKKRTKEELLLDRIPLD